MFWEEFLTVVSVLEALNGVTRDWLILAQDKDCSGRKIFILADIEGLRRALQRNIFGTACYYEVVVGETGLYVDLDGPGEAYDLVLGVVSKLEKLFMLLSLNWYITNKV